MFCIYLRTNSDLCHLLHKLIGFYNPDEKCLQRGTDWCFKYSGLRFVFKGLMEAISDKYVTSDTILDAWHCPLGAIIAHTVGEMGASRLHAMCAVHVFVKHRDL